MRKAQDEYSDTGAVPYITRTPEEVLSLFPAEGMEWVEPGFVSVPSWRPDLGPGVHPVGPDGPAPADAYGGVIRKL